jgi:diguanylate cyclase (GGDEF)-like protein
VALPETLAILRKTFDYLALCSACEEGLHVIVQACRKHFGCSAAAFLLTGLKRRNLKIKSAVGISQGFIKTFKTKADSEPYGTVMQERKELVLSGEESSPEQLSAFKLERDIAHAAVLPVYALERTFGYLQCERDSVPFSEEELDMARLFARMAGMVICNAECCEKILRIQPVDEKLGTLTSSRFFDRMDEELKRAKRYDRCLALMLIHFDAYSEYIDFHGTEAGDALVEVLADVLKGAVRESDFISRYDLESYAACLIEAGAEEAMTVARRIIYAFLHSDVEHREPELRVSIGVAHTAQAGFDTRNVMGCARKALLAAQRSGKNRAVLYEEMS